MKNMPPNHDPITKDDSRALIFYKFVIDSLPTGVLTVNADLKITGFNHWAEKVTGYCAEEAMGRYCGEILQGYAPCLLPPENGPERA
jgi:nitrogen fixation/metabolism regulation signal transduction histidine kinase